MNDDPRCFTYTLPNGKKHRTCVIRPLPGPTQQNQLARSAISIEGIPSDAMNDLQVLDTISDLAKHLTQETASHIHRAVAEGIALFEKKLPPEIQLIPRNT